MIEDIGEHVDEGDIEDKVCGKRHGACNDLSRYGTLPAAPHVHHPGSPLNPILL